MDERDGRPAGSVEPATDPATVTGLADAAHPAHPTPPAEHSVRRPTDDDLEAIAALYERVAVRSSRGTTGEGALRGPDDIRRTWAGRRDEALLVERDLGEDGPVLVGYLEFHEDLDPWTPALDLYVEGRVDPRTDARLVGDFLHRRALARARRATARSPGLPTTLRTTAVDPTPATIAWFADRGLTPERHLLRLRIDLDRGTPDPVWPDGLTGASASAVDDETVHAALVASFADHHLGATDDLESWRAVQLQRGWVDLEVSTVAVAPTGDVVGVSLGRLGDEGDPAQAAIVDLGVVPSWRGRGVATALLRASFQRLAAAGAVGVALEVDDVTLDGALRLYQRAGMEVVHHVWVMTTDPLTPAGDPATGRSA